MDARHAGPRGACRVVEQVTRVLCPDGGTCHHECAAKCFRVTGCVPLSGVFPGDVWPIGVLASHADGVATTREAVAVFVAGALADCFTSDDRFDVELPESDPGRIDVTMPNGSRFTLRVEAVW